MSLEPVVEQVENGTWVIRVGGEIQEAYADWRDAIAAKETISDRMKAAA